MIFFIFDKKICTPPQFFWGWLKIQKIIFNQFSRHLRQFRTTLIFFILTKICCTPPNFFWGGGLKSSKLIFDQFSCHFLQFWKTLIFLIVDKKMFYAPHMFCLTEKFAYWVPIKALPNKLWYFLWIVVLQSGNEFTYCFKISIITTGMLEHIEFPSLRIHV